MRNDVLDSINRILVKTSGHTPGPWHVDNKVGESWAVRAEDGRGVLLVLKRDEYHPDGTLAAAAPDMRALLERIGTLLGQLHPLAVTASSSTGEGKKVRAARDELVRVCLELGGEA